VHAGVRGVRSLSVASGHLELPDLRIEDETADGRDESCDVQTRDRARLACSARGWTQSGFSLYCAAGSGRRGTGVARQGGTPIDPHHVEYLG
jgi:hypothetical protein